MHSEFGGNNMECNEGKPILFSALSSASGYLTDFSDGSSDAAILAKSYVVPQEYTNIMAPDSALIAGTMFCDLYKPYYIIEPRNCEKL